MPMGAMGPWGHNHMTTAHSCKHSRGPAHPPLPSSTAYSTAAAVAARGVAPREREAPKRAGLAPHPTRGAAGRERRRGRRSAPEWALDEEELSSDSEGELGSSDSDSSSGEEVSTGPSEVSRQPAQCPVGFPGDDWCCLRSQILLRRRW